jgi:hypothetical protein
MASLPLSNSRGSYDVMRDMKWSQTEKTVARAAFDSALRHELDEITAEAKQRAAKAKEPSDLWELEAYLTESRKYIDNKYDYRDSILAEVFGVLVQEGRLTEMDFQGLSQDKLNMIRHFAQSKL